MEDESVITVTRINERPMVVNADQIRSVEQNPDTVITMLNGDHFVVRESMQEIVQRTIEYGRHLRSMMPPD